MENDTLKTTLAISAMTLKDFATMRKVSSQDAERWKELRDEFNDARRTAQALFMEAIDTSDTVKVRSSYAINRQDKSVKVRAALSLGGIKEGEIYDNMIESAKANVAHVAMALKHNQILVVNGITLAQVVSIMVAHNTTEIPLSCMKKDKVDRPVLKDWIKERDAKLKEAAEEQAKKASEARAKAKADKKGKGKKKPSPSLELVENAA